MDTSYSLLLECLPLNKPLGLNGIIIPIGNMWDIVENGYELPKIIVDNIAQLKVKSLWNEEERKKHLLPSKVK